MSSVVLAMLKGIGFVLETIFDGVQESGKAVNRETDNWLTGDDEPPTRQRISYYYSGPGSREDD